MKDQIINLHATLLGCGITLRIYSLHNLRTGADENMGPASGRDIVFGLNYRLFSVEFYLNIICGAVFGGEVAINQRVDRPGTIENISDIMSILLIS
jgi:hypothetical protein